MIMKVAVAMLLSKTLTIMKKEYTTPVAMEVELEATNMLAASLEMNDDRVPTSGQLSSGRRGRWGNLWSKE